MVIMVVYGQCLFCLIGARDIQMFCSLNLTSDAISLLHPIHSEAKNIPSEAWHILQSQLWSTEQSLWGSSPSAVKSSFFAACHGHAPIQRTLGFLTPPLTRP